MDPALLAIATSSANALISLMTTDVWERAKSGVTTLFARWSNSEAGTDAELESCRAELNDSSARGDLDETVAEMQQMWKGKFRRLIASHPEAVEELRTLIDLHNEFLGERDDLKSPTINQSAAAHDNARIYQVGSGVQNNS
ncbi:hypothetical protein OHA33_27105 [Streptomyces sp. NBC_00562]|uniref:hypothetical protein n=1 Tax=Streptomyces sp. NBC_00562 TaxID=2975777 RepID=UPI002E823F76|nr:hypothetical protein [Streptomyces sp. NBC_00562]WUC22240.1 hypothetical protein OHA33_27105 [Streptomyces sp. NBC_00562]